MTIQLLSRSPLAVEIQHLCDQHVQKFHPQKIILLGLHAYGKPGPDSDVDLLVVLPFEGKSVYKSIDILVKTDPRFPIDLLARMPEKVQERLAMGDFFMRELVQKGIVLYESADA